MTSVNGPYFLVIFAVLIVLSTIVITVAKAVAKPHSQAVPNIFELAYIKGEAANIHALLTVLVASPQRLMEVERNDDPNLYAGLSHHPLVIRAQQLVPPERMTYLAIKHDAQISSQIKDLRKHMIAKGMIVNPTAPLFVIAKAFGLAVILLGVLRLVIGIANGKPVLFLIILLLIGGLIVLMQFFTAPTKTMKKRADAMFTDVRTRMGGAAPGAPALGLPLAVALGGATMVWQYDPTLAGHARTQLRWRQWQGVSA